MKGCSMGEHLVNTLVNTFLLLVYTLHTLSIYTFILIRIIIYNKFARFSLNQSKINIKFDILVIEITFYINVYWYH